VIALALECGLPVSAHVLQKAEKERQKRRPRERAASEQEELMRRWVRFHTVRFRTCTARVHVLFTVHTVLVQYSYSTRTACGQTTHARDYCRCREVLAKFRQVNPENTTIISITDNLLDNVARLDRWTAENGFKWEGQEWCHTLDKLLDAPCPCPSPNSAPQAFNGPAIIAYLVGVARRAANQLVL
jgi:hypothetical protein